MSEPFDINRGTWWRFSRYQLKDGYIRPVKGAKLEEYDPWQAYRESWEFDPAMDTLPRWANRRKQDSPYQSLLNLINTLSFKVGTGTNRFLLTTEGEKSLLEWCAQNGLLGILPQRVQMVTLAPRWTNGDELYPPPPTNVYRTIIRYIRDNTERSTRGWAIGMDISNPTPDLSLWGQLVSEEYQPSTGMRPGVLLHSAELYYPHGIEKAKQSAQPIMASSMAGEISTSAWKEEPLSLTWARFFPDVPKEERETYMYPAPLTEHFWEIYAEHIEDFVTGALTLYEGVVNRFEEEINSLIAPVSMVIRESPEDTFSQEWVSPSLLASFAVMAAQDLTQHRRLQNCENCNKLFVTESYQARYCSDRCRRTSQKRRYRQRLKERQDNE